MDRRSIFSGQPYKKVKGHCPRGCGQTLFLSPAGFVTCSWGACPEPDAAATMLENGEWIFRASLASSIPIDNKSISFEQLLKLIRQDDKERGHA